MKKEQIYTVIMVLMVILMLPLLNQLMGNSNMPFKSLKVEDIKDIGLNVQPPNKSNTITDIKHIQEIVEALNILAVTEEESAKVDYSAQLVAYTLNKNDGSSVEIKIYSPYLIIDEKIYKSSYEKCDTLNLLGNDLINN